MAPRTGIGWLARNKFSHEWQETFKYLNLHGTQFLDLGTGHGRRGYFRVLHEMVYPRLAKDCSSNGTEWDPAREREGGERLRRLIRAIVMGRTGEQMTFSQMQQESTQCSIPSAGTDGRVNTMKIYDPLYLHPPELVHLIDTPSDEDEDQTYHEHKVQLAFRDTSQTIFANASEIPPKSDDPSLKITPVQFKMTPPIALDPRSFTTARDLRLILDIYGVLRNVFHIRHDFRAPRNLRIPRTVSHESSTTKIR